MAEKKKPPKFWRRKEERRKKNIGRKGIIFNLVSIFIWVDYF